MTDYYVPGGRDAESARPDTYVPTGGGSSKEQASGCPFALPRVAWTVLRLLATASLAGARRIGGAR